jgi:hypothetical protein
MGLFTAAGVLGWADEERFSPPGPLPVYRSAVPMSGDCIFPPVKFQLSSKLNFNLHASRIFPSAPPKGSGGERRKKHERRALMEFWLLEILRLGAAFGLTALIVWFWYWLMDSIGTF